MNVTVTGFLQSEAAAESTTTSGESSVNHHTTCKCINICAHCVDTVVVLKLVKVQMAAEDVKVFPDVLLVAG